MAKVPYSAVPTVEPVAVPTPYNSGAGGTPEAFGSQVATAVQGAGREIGQFADTLFKHQVLLKDRENTADEATLELEFDKEAGFLKADFETLEGKNREAALPAYMDNLAKLRTKYLEQAPNVEVAKKFDVSVKRRLGNMIVGAAGGAAAQTRQYIKEANEARIKLAAKDAAEAAFTSNDLQFQDALAAADKAATALSDSAGHDEPTRELQKTIAKSAVWASGLERLSQRNPEAALKKFEQHRSEMSGDVQEKVYHNIITNYSTVQARISGERIISQSPGLLHERKAEPGVRTEQLDNEFKSRLSKIIADAEAATGERVVITSASRTMEEQEEIYRRSGFGTRFMAAPPGSSRHEIGAAVDLKAGKALDWIRANVDKYGLEKLSNRDPGHIQMARESVGTREVDDSPMTGKTPESRIPFYLDEAKKEADKTFPNDPAARQRFYDGMESWIVKKYAIEKRVVKEGENLARNTVQGELLNKNVVTVEQLSPEARAAFDSMPPTTQRSMQRQMELNAVGDVPETPTRRNRYLELKGLFANLNTRQQFFDTNMAEQDLTNAAKKELGNMQIKERGKLEDKHGFNAALRDVRGLLNDADPQIGESVIDRERNRRFLEFQGAFTEERDLFISREKRLPTPDENRTIATRILVDRAHHWLQNINPFHTPTKMYQAPSDFAEKVKQEFKDRNMPPPTTRQIYNLYQRSLQ